MGRLVKSVLDILPKYQCMRGHDGDYISQRGHCRKQKYHQGNINTSTNPVSFPLSRSLPVLVLACFSSLAARVLAPLFRFDSRCSPVLSHVLVD